MPTCFLLQRTISDIQLESLRKQLIDSNSLHSKESVESLNYAHNGCLIVEKNANFRESDAILVIKRLQEQVLFFPFFTSLFINDSLSLFNFLIFEINCFCLTILFKDQDNISYSFCQLYTYSSVNI